MLRSRDVKISDNFFLSLSFSKLAHVISLLHRFFFFIFLLSIFSGFLFSFVCLFVCLFLCLFVYLFVSLFLRSFFVYLSFSSFYLFSLLVPPPCKHGKVKKISTNPRKTKPTETWRIKINGWGRAGSSRPDAITLLVHRPALQKKC